jgi:hypothetical protein
MGTLTIIMNDDKARQQFRETLKANTRLERGKTALIFLNDAELLGAVASSRNKLCLF